MGLYIHTVVVIVCTCPLEEATLDTGDMETRALKALLVVVVASDRDGELGADFRSRSGYMS